MTGAPRLAMATARFAATMLLPTRPPVEPTTITRVPALAGGGGCQPPRARSSTLPTPTDVRAAPDRRGGRMEDSMDRRLKIIAI